MDGSTDDRGVLEGEGKTYVIRDRDKIYGEEFRRRLRSLSMKEVISGFQSPWQNAYVERLIGSIRRECLDHVVVLSHGHLRRLLKSYMGYYHLWLPKTQSELE